MQTLHSSAGACEKLYLDLGFGDDFRRVLQFSPLVTPGLSRISRNMAEKVTKNEIPNSKYIVTSQLLMMDNYKP